MKINFIVCEDNNNTRKIICDWLKNYIDNKVTKLLLATSQPEKILQVLCQVNGVAICLLDINLNTSINGIALAEKIRSMNPQTKIIFITAYAEWVVESINRNIEPFAYLIKPLEREIFDWHIKRVLGIVKKAHESKLERVKGLIKLEAYGRSYYKNANNITHVETHHKEGYVIAHTSNGERIIHKSRLGRMLDYLNKISNNSFIQCYKSILVNHYYIESINKRQGQILLKDGTILFLSRKKSIQERIEKRIMGDINA